MSDIRANTISDAAGTGPIDLYKQSAAKAWGVCDATGTAINVGTFNVSSIFDNGLDGKNFSLISAFNDIPLAAFGQEHIARWGNRDGFLTAGTAGVSSTLVSVRYYSGSVFSDTSASFIAHGDLA